MDIRFQSAPGGKWKVDCALVFALEGEELTAPALVNAAPWMEISPARRDFRGKKDEQAMLHGHPESPIPRVLAMGLGKAEKFTVKLLRLAVARGVALCRDKGFVSLGLPLENLAPLAERLNLRIEVLLKELGIAAQLALYRCDAYRGEKDAEAPKDPRILNILTEKKVSDALSAAVREAEAESAGMLLARELINGPANHITPTVLAEKAAALAKAHGFTCKVLEPAAIRKLGMGAFWAVAQGARQEPRFVILEHCPKGKKKDAPLVFVGKGITFDTGGISLKPPANMHEMKGDMGGAAAVLGFFEALGRMPDKDTLPRIIGLMPLCENMPGGGSVRPGDVVTTFSGKTVEILNTDAEGRLILCDALSYAQKEWKPKAMVDIATLTGACVIALGDLGAGLFTKDAGLRRAVLDAADLTDDLFWPLPLWEEYDANLKSDVADFANIGPREGGALHAALFLQRFIEKGARWAHLDIAGPGYVVKSTPLHPVSGGTGVGVRIFCELARRLEK